MKSYKKQFFGFFLFLTQLCTAQQPPMVCYEIFVRSFADSNGDGIGDLNGITAKLDYLQDLGIKAVWLTPICKSRSYHKYDVEDYYTIDPEYGTLDDFKRLLAEAHKRDIKVLKDLVVNHTSSAHPWFLEARKGKSNPYRSYYNWLSPQSIDSLGLARREETPDTKEVNPWHFAHKDDDEKYYGLFSSRMPDLNYDNEQVRREMYAVARYWLQLGVDGFRLDAAKHIYPDWEAEKSHLFWQEFRHEMETVKGGVYLVGEVWSTADKVAPFFKGLKALFDFDLHEALIRVVRHGKNDSLVQSLKKALAIYAKVNPDFINATFLTNHDQNRIGSELKGDVAKLKVAANLLLTLPGEPYLYYGEELGMLGVKPDERIREPFLWDVKAKDNLRTHWSSRPLLSTDTTVLPLQIQKKDPQSLYNHYKKLIYFRESQPALRQVLRPNIEVFATQAEVIAFVRPHPSGDLLVLQNVSGAAQTLRIGRRFKTLLFKTEPVRLQTSALELQPYGLAVLKR
jgi:alpha-amylase